MKYLFILLIIMNFWFFVCSSLIKNISPQLTNNITNSYYSPTHLSDEDLTTYFSTGTIKPLSNFTIIYNLTSTFYLSEIVVFWLYNILPFEISISKDNKTYNTIYSGQIIGDEYSLEYQDLLETSMTNIGEANFIKFNIINNIIHYYGNSIIKDIEVQGFNVHTQLISISPNNIPINSNPEFDYTFHENIPFTLSKYNSCNISTTTFDTSGTYYTCYKDHIQSPTISVHNIDSIEPHIIHISSFSKLNINSTLTPNIESSIGLNNDCSNTRNIKSITNIYYDNINFFEQTGITGTYPVCLGIGDLWGKTNQKIELVKPIVYKVSGCEDKYNYTENCDTRGGNTIYIYGDNFFNYYSNPIISYDIFNHYDNIIHNSTCIQSVLPEGYGHNISVRAQFEISSDDKHLLSYSKPSIERISGCIDVNKTTTHCPNNDSFVVNIIGNNFGKDSSTILIGSNMCNNISHNSHTNISCILDGSRGINNVIYVIQNRGKISDGKKLLSYTECPIGYELISDNCIICNKGFYKNTISDTNCMLCADGYYSNTLGSHSCKTCQDNSFSNKARTSCICKEGYYMNTNNICEECDNTDFFGDIVYICDTSGLTIQSLQNNKGYWRNHHHSTDFYKCRQKDYCPINHIINNTVQCLDYHTGILCDMCISGYAKNNNGFLRKMF